MRQPQVGILSLVSLFALAGCGTGGGAPPSAKAAFTSEPRPVLVFGVLAPRDGLAIPAETEIEIVLRREDDPSRVLAIHPLAEVRTWPVQFDVPVEWPNVPNEGEKVTWKASPPILSVFARGAVAGQLAYISESQRYTVEDSVNRRAMNLVLVPVRE